MQIKITTKFRASRRLRFEDTKRIMSLEKFLDLRETGPVVVSVETVHGRLLHRKPLLKQPPETLDACIARAAL